MKTPDQWADAAWEWFDPKDEIDSYRQQWQQTEKHVKDVVRETVKLALEELISRAEIFLKVKSGSTFGIRQLLDDGETTAEAFARKHWNE